jgi:hypothetical protein
LKEVLIQMAFTLKVKGFDDGEAIPKRYTCDGEPWPFGRQGPP